MRISQKKKANIPKVIIIKPMLASLKQLLTYITPHRPCTVSLKSSEDGVKKSMLFEFEERVLWILDVKCHFSVRSVLSLDLCFFVSRQRREKMILHICLHSSGNKSRHHPLG